LQALLNPDYWSGKGCRLQHAPSRNIEIRLLSRNSAHSCLYLLCSVCSYPAGVEGSSRELQEVIGQLPCHKAMARSKTGGVLENMWSMNYKVWEGDLKGGARRAARPRRGRYKTYVLIAAHEKGNVEGTVKQAHD